jgi:type III pantothenate kinase
MPEKIHDYASSKMHDHHRLIIDVGNTFVKVAVFQYNELIDLKTVPSIDTTLLDKLKKDHDIRAAIISAVTDVRETVTEYLRTNFQLIELDHHTPVPITNLYRTPETLGKDRLAVVVAAAARFPGEDCLVVDAGTCITFDFIDKQKNYHGGSISPGMLLRFKSLNTFTGRLPLVTHRNFEVLTGKTTEESILAGVLNGIAAEVDGMIGMYRDQFPGLKVIITGGDMNFLAKKLKSNIFAVPNLLLFGLNEILEFNEHQ